MNMNLYVNEQTRISDVSTIVLRRCFRRRSNLGIMAQSTGVSFSKDFTTVDWGF